MRYLYATQFNVRESTIKDVQELIDVWFHGSYLKRTGEDLWPEYDGETRRPSPGHTLYVLHEEVGEGQLLQLRWTHPDGDDKHLQWTTNVMLAEADGELEFGTTVSISSRTFQIRPTGRINAGAPGIVRDVLEKFECGLTSLEIPTGRVLVDVDEAPLLVEGVLESEERALPVVLISQDPQSGHPLCNVRRVQKRLTGLAHVYEISREASFELTGLVGKARSCYNGAVRLYWPGFDREDPYYRRHTLYLPDHIEKYERENRPLRYQLFRTLSKVASSRFRRGNVWHRLRRRAKQKRHRELENLREKIENREEGVDEVIDELAEEYDELLDEKNRLEERNSQLEKERANYEENLTAIREGKMSAEALASDEPEAEPDELSFNSVSEAVQKAEEGFGEWIDVWSSAREAAKESTFARPEEVYEALEAVADLAALDSSDESTGPWDKFFEERGIKYAPTESQNTQNMFGDDRIFNDRGTEKREQMLRHLTLGGASRENCLTIHFARDGERNVFNVGYCGKHLPHFSRDA